VYTACVVVVVVVDVVVVVGAAVVVVVVVVVVGKLEHNVISITLLFCIVATYSPSLLKYPSSIKLFDPDKKKDVLSSNSDS